jgi:two-component system, NarL family, sensor histidine kinase DesK
LATNALEDTRALVQGYRRTTLEAEIANATRVLAAADIDTRTNLEPADDLDPARRHLLGLVMREATTNMLRHSRAQSAEVECTVADGFVRLRVSNDGADAAGGAAGSGLRTLAERLEAAGGGLKWESEEDRFTVTAELPVEAPRGNE